MLLLALGLAALAGVLLGQFRPWVVLPLAALLAAATWRLVPPPPKATRAHLGALAVAVALAVGWVALGLRSVAEYVVVNRDPGFLTLQALWLTRNPAAPIPVGSAEAAAAAAPGASAGTEAFWLHDGLLHAQGNKLVPALLAVQGWAGGERAVLAGNLLLGAVALLAVFAAARRFAGPVWALVPTAALALSLPYLEVTRAAYTEPVTVAFLAGGLALAHGLWHGPGGGLAVVRAVPARWALVGALNGATAAARIDGAVVVAGLALACVLLGVAPLGAADRRGAVRGALASLAAGTAMVVLGMGDVLLLSPEYVRIHASQLTALTAATGVLVLVAVVVLLLPGRALAAARTAVHARRRVLGLASAGVVLLLGLVLASRPLWWQGRSTDPATGFGYAVSVLQEAAGQAIDPARSYDEQSLAWVGWYLGVPAVVLGFAGLALLARRGVALRDPAAVLLVAVVGVAAVFPLVRVNITPDQVWAARRLVPATFPGLLIAASCALAALAGRWRSSRGAAPWARRADEEPWRAARAVAAAGLGVGVAVFPLTTWGAVASHVELSGRATQAHAVCDALADLGVERVVWTHSSPFRYLATLRVLCGVEVVEFVEPPTRADLAAVRDAWGGGPVAALSFDADDYVWTVPPGASVGGTASSTLARTLTGPPTTVETTWSEVWLGLVQDDGTVAPAG